MKVLEKMNSFDAIMKNSWSGAIDVCKEMLKAILIKITDSITVTY